jgi:hypothetical protein
MGFYSTPPLSPLHTHTQSQNFNSGRSREDRVTQKKSVGVDMRWGSGQLHPELVELVSVAIWCCYGFVTHTLFKAQAVVL